MFASQLRRPESSFPFDMMRRVSPWGYRQFHCRVNGESDVAFACGGARGGSRGKGGRTTPRRQRRRGCLH